MTNLDVVGRPARGAKALLVVPKLEVQQRWTGMIDPGSGIAAFRMASDTGMLTLYYESNRHGFANVNTLEDMAVNAYGRLVAAYPTVARCVGSADEFVVVGTVDFNGIELEDKGEAFAAWMAHKPGLPIRSESVMAYRGQSGKRNGE